MTTYVWRDGRFVDKASGEDMYIPERDGVQLPQFMPDTPEYLSPVTGLPITSRSHRREDLRRHDCVEAPPRKKREYQNQRYRESNHRAN